MLNKKAIETISVNAVRDSIVMSDFLDQFIPDNDKEPSWDGNVYIYNEKDKKKEHLKGRLPVQVKGTENNDFSKDEISYSVSTADLTNYLNDGGVVFFVVYIGNGGFTRQIYYLDLPPIKLRIYLSGDKSKKNKTIKLKKFPVDNNKKALIFFQCFENCQKQSSFSSAELLSLDELESRGVLEGITIPITTINGMDPKYALLTSDVYIYANIKGSAIPQPLEIIPQHLSTKEEIEASVSINDKLFYSEISIINDSEKTTLYLGSSLSIISQNDKRAFKMKYQNSESLRTLAVDLDFMISYIENGSFQINGINYPFNYENADFSNFDIEKQKERLELAKRYVKVLDSLGCKKDIKCNELSTQDWRYFDYLATSILDGKPISNLKEDLPLIALMNVGPLKFAVCMKKVKGTNETYNILDFFKTEIVMVYENEAGEKLPISQYIILHSDNLLNIDNIKYESLLPSFMNTERHVETIQQANLFLLEIINAYDRNTAKKELLSTAEAFSDWIFSSTEEELPYTIKLLNKLQIIKRKRALSNEEIKDLISIVENPENDEESLVGAYLLLEQQQAAEVHFEKLSEEGRKRFIEYPIYHFWKPEED